MNADPSELRIADDVRCYRMFGRVTDAGDAVQDAFLRLRIENDVGQTVSLVGGGDRLGTSIWTVIS